MKILFAAIPVAGHLNPLLAIARMARARGDEVLLTTGTHLRPAVEAAGARFLPLAPGADIDMSRFEEAFPDISALPAGPEKLRRLYERCGIDPMPFQAATLRELIDDERPDIVVSDGAFFGRVALFLDPHRPPVPLVSCGFTVQTLDRPDGAPFGAGLPPARDDAARARYAEIAAEAEVAFAAPMRVYADAKLAEMGLPPLPCSVVATSVVPADAYLQLTVPAFEYDYGPLPAHIRFVGALPPPPADRPLPRWWGELDSGKPVVLVTQGTMANGDLGELIEPALTALAERDDLLVVVTTGGRPIESVSGPIPKNARLSEFLDYEALLPKLSVLVTNGGYGTVSLALRAGVPIVAAGRTEDKAEVGARVAWSGVGVEIPLQRPNAEDLRAAVERVLTEPAYRARAQAIAADMAAIDTRAEILGVLDRLVAQGPMVQRSERLR